MPTLDTFGRPLGSLRISVTDRCNLRCQYCMPEKDYVWLPRKDILTFEETSFLVDVFASIGVDKVRITGGEPLLRKDLTDLIRLLAAKAPIRDLALTTNGVLLAEQASALRAAGLHRITVSLDTLRPDRFRDLTRFDSLALVQAGLAEAARANFANIKIDTVVIRGVNDDELANILEYGRCVPGRGPVHRVHGCRGRHPMVTRRRRPTHRDPPRDREAVWSRDTDRRDEFSARRPIPAAGWDHVRHHLVDDGAVLPFMRPQSVSPRTASGTCVCTPEPGTDLRQPLRAGASATALRDIIEPVWRARNDRGAEVRLTADDRRSLIPVDMLQREPHLEMHTRGG